MQCWEGDDEIPNGEDADMWTAIVIAAVLLIGWMAWRNVEKGK